jgi:long-chain acyl-CoA synthetase
MSLNLAVILRESVKRHPAKQAIVIGDKALTYAELHAHAQRFAAGLLAAGVKPGDRVALLLPNVPQFSIAYFGILYAGGVVVPLNVLLTGEEVAYHLQDSAATAIVAWEGFVGAAETGFRRTDECHHLVVVEAAAPGTTGLPAGATSFAGLVGGNEPLPDPVTRMPDDTAVILYTSGTTGRPKGAELTHFNMFFNSQYSRTMLLPLTPDDVALATLPLFHSFGQTVVQNAILGAGGTLVMLPRFDPESAFALMDAHRITLFAGVPTMYFALLHHPQADAFDARHLKYCVSGGSAMPVEVMRSFDEKFGVNVLEGYGLSETSPVASFNVLDQPKKAGSIGLPIWGVEFRLEDEQGNVVDTTGVPGEICIKGHNVMKGYWRRPEVTDEIIRDGWFHSGDIGTRDDDGYYFIVDRKKDMIIRGGFNVYPREIEEVLYGHPAVAEAAVIGVPHPSHGEEIAAIVALKPGAEVDEDELIAYSREHLAAYKYPRSVQFRDELPKGPTGKILKRELKG